MSYDIKNREEIVESIEKKHLVLLPDGGEIALDYDDRGAVMRALENVSDRELKIYIESEELKGAPGVEPPSIKIMRQHELIDYEPASDSGHFRFYPKGHLIFELLSDWAREIAVNRIGAMQIDSPVIYDWSDPEIREQAGSFHERHYRVGVPDDERKEFILRFAGDFGLFKIMKSAKFSHRVLPLRVYEFSKSFRYEKSGELSGLKRLRAFHMPDVHCFCRDIRQGFSEYMSLYRHYCDLADGIGIKYAIGFRILESFYRQHREKIMELVRYSGRPVFVELLSEMKHYWVLKHEFQGIDGVGGCVQLSTVQLDIKDAAVYGINYVDADGSKKGCIICHSSIGSIERWIYLILEDALLKKPAILPLWLAPSQLRIIPVSEKHLEYCKGIGLSGVRFDVDDRDEPLAKKIARAGMEWIPYVAVIGDREIASGKLSVRRREPMQDAGSPFGARGVHPSGGAGGGAPVEMSPEEIEREIKSLCAGFPFRQLPLARLLSMRPVFFG